MTPQQTPKPDPVQLINRETGLFWIAGLARELWPALVNRPAELTDEARIAVEHYARCSGEDQ